MKKIIIIASILVLSMNAVAKPNKVVSLKQQAFKQTYEKIVYRDNRIYEIYSKPLNATAIIFDKNELVKNLLLSDPVGWNATINENQVYLKPVEEVTSSTLFVTTTKRTYFFRLYANVPKAYNPVIQFVYPDEERAFIQNYELLKKQREQNRMSLNIGDIDELNYLYKWNKRYSWSPTNIFDNGKKTWIFLSTEDKVVPTFYLKRDGEFEIALSYRVRENKVTGQKIIELDGTFKEAELHLHKKKIKIVNKAKR